MASIDTTPSARRTLGIAETETRQRKRLPREAYTIAVICPLEVEMSAARYMLHEEHHELGANSPDCNHYVLGQYGDVNVVIAWLPTGTQGIGSAAKTTADMKHSFPSVSLRLLVGIAGGLPNDENDIRLGDVVVSVPTGPYGGVLQHDLGKETPEGLVLKGYIHPPPQELLSIITRMRSDHLQRENKISTHISQMFSKHPQLVTRYQRPSSNSDVLFGSDAIHRADATTCINCDRTDVVRRCIRRSDNPEIFYGLVASGNQVIKHAAARDRIGAIGQGATRVLCLEMEAAGMNDPCLVIRGISDYADSHKNDEWQPYAAAAAAGLCKEILSYIQPAVPRPRTRISAQEDEVIDQCLRDLFVINPKHEMEQLQRTKDYPLRECYEWVLADQQLRSWKEDADCRLLWIKGDAGKGKTMLMIALADELSRPQLSCYEVYLASFFCRSTDSKLNRALSVLRGLVWMIVYRYRHLANHLLAPYKASGKVIFEDSNALGTLMSILTDLLRDPAMPRIYLLVDAIDECNFQQVELLDFIRYDASDPCSKAKWLVSSRPEVRIQVLLQPYDGRKKLDLELNAVHISKAVDTFITQKVSELARDNCYPSDLVARTVRQLSEKAESTFLWVSLACKELREVRAGMVWSTLESLPSGLGPLYERMLQKIMDLKAKDDRGFCLQILQLMVVVYQPLHVKELASLAGLPDDIRDDLNAVQRLTHHCGSFLTIHENIVHFIHQSAKDFLSSTPSSIGLTDTLRVQYDIFARSVTLMGKTLKKDICNLKDPGTSIDKIHHRTPDPLDLIRYSCLYWVDHLCEMRAVSQQQELCDDGRVHKFLKASFLYWLEALSLVRNLWKAPLLMTELERLLAQNHSQILDLVRDARRFILFHREAIESYPLQAYASALLFSPTKSLVRMLFKEEIPKWIHTNLAIDENWGALLFSLEGHAKFVVDVAFSPNGHQLASAALNGTVQLRDSATGRMLSTIKVPNQARISYLPDGSQLAVSTKEGPLLLFDTTTGEQLRKLSPYSGFLSPDGRLLASVLGPGVRLFHMATGEVLRELSGCDSEISAVAFSPDSRHIAAVSNDGKIHVWNKEYSTPIQTLHGESDDGLYATLSINGQHLAYAPGNGTVQIWNTENWTLWRTIKNLEKLAPIAFSPDGGRFALVYNLTEVQIGNTEDGALLKVFEGHSDRIHRLRFSPDGRLLASASFDQTVRIWDTTATTSRRGLEQKQDRIKKVTTSPNGQYFVSQSTSDLAAWNGETGRQRLLLKLNYNGTVHTTFSSDGRYLAIATNQKVLQLWDAETNKILWKLECNHILAIAFSSESHDLAFATGSGEVWLCNTETGPLLRMLIHPRLASITFSPNGEWLAYVVESTIQLWDVATSTPRELVLQEACRPDSIVFSPDGRRLALASILPARVRVWDIPTPGEPWRPPTVIEPHIHDYFLLFAFTPDGRQIVSRASKDEVSLWDAETGARLHKLLQPGMRELSLLYDQFVSGTLSLIPHVPAENPPQHATGSIRNCPGIGLSLDGKWISWKGKNILQIPLEYRPHCMASTENVIVMDYGHKLLLITVIPHLLPS